MKRLLSGLLAAASLFTACKKENGSPNPSPDDQKKYAVQFNISPFTYQIEDIQRIKGQPHTLKTAGDSLKEYVNYIVYKVYDAQTQSTVKTIFQRSEGNSAFGQVFDTLPTGRYVITITAAKDSIMPFVAANEAFLDALPGRDIFYKRMELTISGAVIQPVVLDRIVSKVTVTIKDQIPYTARSFSYWPSLGFYDGIPSYFQYFSGIPDQGPGHTYVYSVKTRTIPDSLRGTMDYRFEFYMINTDTIRTTLHLKCMDAMEQVIASKDVLVLLVRNKNTAVRGSLFAPVENGTTIDLDPDWTADSIHVEF